MIELDKIYNEDCFIGMPHIPDNSVDCIICDLPYGTTDCAWDSVIPIKPLWEQYKRILKHQGSVLLFGSEPFSTMLRMSNLDWFKYDWIWQKNVPTGFQHAKNMPLKDFEIISVFSAAKIGHINLLGENRMTYHPQGLTPCHIVKNGKKSFINTVGSRPSHKDVVIRKLENYPRMILCFDSQAGEGANNVRIHPTQKPVDLLRYFILTYTSEGDIVLDNCSGSGTTAVACIREKRHFICFEKDETYWEKSVERIKCEQKQLRLF